jgi:hypothetical protein
MLNREKFFTSIKASLFTKGMTQSQVNGTNVILNEWELKGYTDNRWLAYMLATVYHETAKTMQPIEEYGKGKGRPYGSKLKMSRVPYSIPDKLFYGRGFVQLTWYENYELMSRLLKVDILNNPELALNAKIATDIMFEGMTKGSSSFGDFTGRCLEQYFNNTTEDAVNARKIINGLDKAELIAGYYNKFKDALKD